MDFDIEIHKDHDSNQVNIILTPDSSIIKDLNTHSKESIKFIKMTQHTRLCKGLYKNIKDDNNCYCMKNREKRYAAIKSRNQSQSHETKNKKIGLVPVLSPILTPNENITSIKKIDKDLDNLVNSSCCKDNRGMNTTKNTKENKLKNKKSVLNKILYSIYHYKESISQITNFIYTKNMTKKDIELEALIFDSKNTCSIEEYSLKSDYKKKNNSMKYFFKILQLFAIICIISALVFYIYDIIRIFMVLSNIAKGSVRYDRNKFIYLFSIRLFNAFVMLVLLIIPCQSQKCSNIFTLENTKIYEYSNRSWYIRYFYGIFLLIFCLFTLEEIFISQYITKNLYYISI